MKKVLAAALLCAVSAFATWDYFPVKDAGKGEAKLGVGYFMQDKLSMLGLNFGARFSVIDGLEIAALLNTAPAGFGLTCSYDGDDCDASGLRQPALSVRYWLPMGVGVAVDVDLPLVSGDNESDDANLGFTPAVQYSAKFGDLELGSQLSFYIPLENGNKYTPPMELGIGLELDYSLGSVTPLIGCDFAIEVAKEKMDGKDDFSADTATGIAPYVGAVFSINDMLAADVTVGFGIGEDYYGDKMPILINANISVNF
jgi:hypothetical protein